MNSRASGILRQAEGYPFDPPLASYVLGGTIDALDLRGRLPVIAAGANASEARLAEQLGKDGGPLPVLRAVLADYVAVYAAHFTRYGSVPATLAEAPGAFCYLFVLWPDPAQLERLHASKALGRDYDFTALSVSLEVDGVGQLSGAHAYVSRAGPLRLAGRPVRLAEVATAGCPWPALFQPALLRLLHRRLDPGCDYESFLASLAADEAYRARAGAALQRLS